ncbi:stress response translation initiation inhibitor YciH [Candidatus Woesearchaeota archaeon]|nr:stress response translation initiation inhibitor YciH [Candidatus Woesearchaeota archaeon]MBW2978544.1 stress response translation initiation inhibitor YciH [Candidatus Woesearchaeota archaeon]
MTVCIRCGLPKDLCVCESIAKETQTITIQTEKKKFGKIYTVIFGLDEKEINLDDLAKKLKAKFACGGTAKKGRIELQGNHKQKVKEFLVSMGFAPETIMVK